MIKIISHFFLIYEYFYFHIHSTGLLHENHCLNTDCYGSMICLYIGSFQFGIIAFYSGEGTYIISIHNLFLADISNNLKKSMDVLSVISIENRIEKMRVRKNRWYEGEKRETGHKLNFSVIFVDYINRYNITTIYKRNVCYT